jgi:hypothetical protein
MNEATLRSCTRRQLIALAGTAKVRGRYRMSKDQLIEAIRSQALAPSPRHRPKESVRPAEGISVRVEIPSPQLVVDAVPDVEKEPDLKELTELPASYGRTRLTLMEIDPYKIHAYWEVTPRDQETAMARLGPERASSHWVLRFYDVTYIDFDGANAHSSFDQPIDVTAGNWYVNLWSSEKTYCADIGVLAPSGRFEPACRSNFVCMPRAGESPDYRPEWLQVEAGLETRATPVTIATTATPNSEPPPRSRPSPSPVTEADVCKYYDELLPPSAATAALTHNGPSQPPSSTAEAGPADGPSMVSAHEPSTAHARGATPVPAMPPGAVGENGPLGARREARSPDTVSSFGSGGWAPARQAEIDLKLNAEVIISGRAQPGQAIQVNGQWVKVNADGTFSVRLALPTRA